MKKIIFWLAFLCLPGAAFAQSFQVEVVSTELNTIDGKMEIDLRIFSAADVQLNHEVLLTPTEGYCWKTMTRRKYILRLPVL